MLEREYGEKNGSGFMLGLLCGAAFGAMLGLMLAPKSGSELRRTIYDSTEDLRKKASHASQVVNETVAKGREAVERGRRAYDDVRKAATEQGQEIYDLGRQAVKDFTTGAQS